MMSLMLSTTLLIMGTVIPGTVQPKCPYVHTQSNVLQATPWTKVAISPQKEEHACIGTVHSASLMEPFIVAFMPTFW